MRFISIVIMASATIGCTSSATTDRPPVEELKEGLNLLDVTDPSWGMTAAYVKGDRVVYLEQRVGALKPQVYRETSPGEPDNEIDMRFVDQNGITFYVQRGGDNFVEPTWANDISVAFKTSAPLERNADFALAREAAAALSKSLPTEFAPLAFHPTAFAARPTPSEDPNLIGRIDTMEAQRPDTQAYWDWGGGEGWWYLQGDLYDKKVCYVWVCVARHSGVAMFAYNGSWSLVVNSCNHGSCPGSSNLTYRCSSNSGDWKQWIYLTGEHSSGSSVSASGCGTNYSWNSGGWDHLCNDDSAYELWQIKHGSAGDGNAWNEWGNRYSFIYNGAGTGGDGSWVNYACNCSANNGCNNDWSRPICP